MPHKKKTGHRKGNMATPGSFLIMEACADASFGGQRCKSLDTCMQLCICSRSHANAREHIPRRCRCSHKPNGHLRPRLCKPSNLQNHWPLTCAQLQLQGQGLQEAGGRGGARLKQKHAQGTDAHEHPTQYPHQGWIHHLHHQYFNLWYKGETLLVDEAIMRISSRYEQ